MFGSLSGSVTLSDSHLFQQKPFVPVCLALYSSLTDHEGHFVVWVGALEGFSGVRWDEVG